MQQTQDAFGRLTCELLDMRCRETDLNVRLAQKPLRGRGGVGEPIGDAARLLTAWDAVSPQHAGDLRIGIQGGQPRVDGGGAGGAWRWPTAADWDAVIVQGAQDELETDVQ